MVHIADFLVLTLDNLEKPCFIAFLFPDAAAVGLWRIAAGTEALSDYLLQVVAKYLLENFHLCSIIFV